MSATRKVMRRQPPFLTSSYWLGCHSRSLTQADVFRSETSSTTNCRFTWSLRDMSRRLQVQDDFTARLGSTSETLKLIPNSSESEQ